MAAGIGALTKVGCGATLEGIEWPRARTGNSGGSSEFRREKLRSSEGSRKRIPLMDDLCRAVARLRWGGVSLSVLNARIAGSALNGAWVNDGDHEQGSVGLRFSSGLSFASRNLAGITGTSGSDARLMVESGDFRVLVDEVERLTDETVDSARADDKDS